MPINSIITHTCELTAPLTVTPLRHNLVTGDQLGDRFDITVTRDGEPVDLTGATVFGYLMRSDGVTVPVPGSAEGSTVSVLLPAVCYEVPGRFGLAVRVSMGDTRHTVYECNGAILRSSTDVVADPGELIPSLDELLEQIVEMERVADEAKTATERADAAAEGAEKVIEATAKAVESATEAASNAETAASQATTAATKADEATEAAAKAAENVKAATERAISASKKAETAADDAVSAANKALESSAHPPMLDEKTGNWLVWDDQIRAYQDTGLQGLLIDQNRGTRVRMWFGTVDEYNALPEIDPNIYYNILEGAP